MNNAHTSVDTAIKEADLLRRNIKNKAQRQVSSSDEQNLIRATALSWFNSHLPEVDKSLGSDFLGGVNDLYKQLLACSDRATTRSKYDALLKAIKKELVEIRQNTVTNVVAKSERSTSNQPPNFNPLISDQRIQEILIDRWDECCRCINAQAPLAATVMMGGLLETLLLARFNREPDKKNIFQSSKIPKDKKTGRPLPMNTWTLRDYIDVAHDLKWISESAKDVGEILRDYRNYVHPYKQVSHGVTLDIYDAQLFWEISKSITRQLIAKIK